MMSQVKATNHSPLLLAAPNDAAMVAATAKMVAATAHAAAAEQRRLGSW